MLTNIQYFTQSITNHLYYLRSMREFCRNIELSFFQNNQDYINTAEDFALKCEELGREVLVYADGNVSKEALENQIFLTNYTLLCEKQTEKLFGINLNTELTEIEMKLRPGIPTNISDEMMLRIEELNKRALILARNFIDFCKDVKQQLETLKLFSYSYPDYFDYMATDIGIYAEDLERIINKESFSPVYAIGYEYYFNESLQKTAIFIRSWVNPSATGVYDYANYFITNFQRLKEDYLKMTLSPDAQTVLINKSLLLVNQYKEFLANIIEQVLGGTLYLIVPPTTLDNFYTSTNFFEYNLRYQENIETS